MNERLKPDFATEIIFWMQNQPNQICGYPTTIRHDNLRDFLMTLMRGEFREFDINNAIETFILEENKSTHFYDRVEENGEVFYVFSNEARAQFQAPSREHEALHPYDPCGDIPISLRRTEDRLKLFFERNAHIFETIDNGETIKAEIIRQELAHTEKQSIERNQKQFKKAYQAWLNNLTIAIQRQNEP